MASPAVQGSGPIYRLDRHAIWKGLVAAEEDGSGYVAAIVRAGAVARDVAGIGKIQQKQQRHPGPVAKGDVEIPDVPAPPSLGAGLAFRRLGDSFQVAALVASDSERRREDRLGLAEAAAPFAPARGRGRATGDRKRRA
ncbi:MAG TPA: hypothetical protein VF759_10455 [Allosphingosinicella sp.]|jgi:hypothetical protein